MRAPLLAVFATFLNMIEWLQDETQREVKQMVRSWPGGSGGRVD
jgi:hypothetical protein